jgi:hypothetical protein
MWLFSKRGRERHRFFRDLARICKHEEWSELQTKQDHPLDADNILIIKALSAYMSWQANDNRGALDKFSALYSESKSLEGILPGYIKRFALYYICLGRGDYASARNHERNAKSTNVSARVKVLLPVAAIYNVPHTPPSISASA